MTGTIVNMILGLRGSNVNTKQTVSQKDIGVCKLFVQINDCICIKEITKLPLTQTNLLCVVNGSGKKNL